jgi:DNA integrity scanning protein DisA with diadenylate cyclase activity
MNMEPHPRVTRLSAELAASAEGLVHRGLATAVLVQRDAIDDASGSHLRPLGERLLVIEPATAGTGPEPPGEHRCIFVPDVPLSRLGQVKIALFMGLTSGLVRRGERIAALTGLSGSGKIDTLMLVDVTPEQELLAGAEAATHLPDDVDFRVFQRLVTIAAELGNEGREGKPVGALFVLGDIDRVGDISRPMILNPFRGYPEDERNLLDDRLNETIKELATIDGAFLVRGDGVVEACGIYLKAVQQGVSDLPPGLGARHHAAAAITAITDALAVAVSESTGNVSVFRRGRLVAEIERSRPMRVKHDAGAGPERT